MFEEKKCCGFDPYPRKATMLGALTFGYPALVLALLGAALLRPLGAGARCPAGRAGAVADALFKLLNASLFPGLRQRAAAGLYSFSPAAAGFVYRRLNFIILSVVWVAACLAAWRFL